MTRTSSREAIRIERIPKIRSFQDAKSYLSDFYKRKRKDTDVVDVDDPVDQVEKALSEFPDAVIVAMAVAVSHLIGESISWVTAEFQPLASIMRLSTELHSQGLVLTFSVLTAVFTRWPHALVRQYSCQSVKLQSRVDLTFREIYRNQTDLGIYGSLMWCELFRLSS